MVASNENIPTLRFKEFKDYWILLRLEDVAEKIQDGTHFSPIQKEKGNYKYITSKNIRNGFMDLRDVKFLDDEAHKEIYKRCDVKFNDILLTKDGASTGAVCLNELHEEFSLLSSVAFLRTKESIATNKFLYQIIAGPKGQNEIQASIAGQAITRITLSKIRNYKFSFPSLLEQQKIASFLSAVDEKIQLLTRKKELLEQYKKGVMQQLFSGKLRFKDENGKDYPEWEEKTLEEVSVKIQDGTHFSPKSKRQGDYYYLTSKNIKNGYIDLKGAEFVSKEDHDSIYRRCDVKKGDVLLTKDGTIGQVCVNNLDDEFSLLSSVSFIRVQEEYSNFFVYHILASPLGQREISNSIAGQALKRITLSKIKNFKYLFPVLQEQQKIAAFLSNIDTKLKSVTVQITQTQTFKKGLLQQMFV